MRYIKTKHWDDIQNQQGLLFFAQILTEALFDYTLDTYKPQALNIRLLCIETLQTIQNIKLGLIKKPNINPVVEELIWSLNADPVAKELVNERVSLIVDRINNQKNDLKKLKETVSLLYHFLDNKKYLNRLKETLIEIIPENKQKEKIYGITKSFITELISYGYSTGYIYHVTNKFFFSYRENFSHRNPSEFFKNFDFENKKFTVVYKVSNLFLEFKDVEDILEFKISAEYPVKSLGGKEKTFIQSKKEDETFIIFEDVEAIDDNVARILTENSLFKLANMFSFYHHSSKPQINDYALVINHVNKYSLLREKPIKSIIKKSDVKPNIAAHKVKSLFSELDLTPNTIYRISRAIDLHSISLTTDQIENKLLNLWTALETLIPKDIDNSEDRIVQISNALMPFQMINYINKLIAQARDDFYHFDRKESKKVIDSVVVKSQEDDENLLMAALILTVENDDIRKSVYALLDSVYPLLKWRLFYLNKKLSNGKEAHSILENHRKKIEWQIRRIYRARNLIVHSGRMPGYTNILVENLHNYFDNFLEYIIDQAISEKRIRTINEAILDCELSYENLVSKLKAIGEEKLTLDKYQEFL